MEKYSFRAKIQKISQLKFGLWNKTVTSALLLYSPVQKSWTKLFHKIGKSAANSSGVLHRTTLKIEMVMVGMYLVML